MVTSNSDDVILSRRNVAKGAAWAAPAMVLASQAPAFASSRDVNLSINGWLYVNWDDVYYSGRCIQQGYMRLTSPPRSAYYPNSYPEDGLWVNNATPETRVDNAKLTMWVKRSDVSTGQLQWEPIGDNSGWTAPRYAGVRRDSSGTEFYIYELYFQGDTTLVRDRLYLDGSIAYRAYFENDAYYSCKTDIMNCMQRDVDITYRRGGETEHRTFKRCVTMRRGLLPSSDQIDGGGRRRSRRSAESAEHREGTRC
ncbi:hypothetical protein ACUH93_02340 [Dermabacteraceae bacterium P7006]